MKKLIIITIAIFLSLIIVNKVFASPIGASIFPHVDDWLLRPTFYECRHVISNGSEQVQTSDIFNVEYSNYNNLKFEEVEFSTAWVCKYSQETLDYMNSKQQIDLILWSVIIFILIGSLIVNIFKTK